MSTCLTCTQWEARGVPAYAAGMGLAFCLSKRTQAVTMAHWVSCAQWQQAPEAAVGQRVVWLKRRGIDPFINQIKTTSA